MCVCGLHFEEGLMVQCGGEGEQSNNSTSSTVQETVTKNNEEEPLDSNDGNKNSKVASNTNSKDKETLLNINKPLKGCGVWQHARCMAVVDVGEPYYCHRCQPREVINYSK